MVWKIVGIAVLFIVLVCVLIYMLAFRPKDQKEKEDKIRKSFKTTDDYTVHLLEEMNYKLKNISQAVAITAVIALIAVIVCVFF